MNSKMENLLASKGIRFRIEGGSIYIPLPNDFGELEYKEFESGDDVLGLVGAEWHTHSECEGGIEGLCSVIQEIEKGHLLCIKEYQPGSKPRKTIETNLQKYLKYLPPGTKYEIYNPA